MPATVWMVPSGDSDDETIDPHTAYTLIAVIGEVVAAIGGKRDVTQRRDPGLCRRDAVAVEDLAPVSRDRGNCIGHALGATATTVTPLKRPARRIVAVMHAEAPCPQAESSRVHRAHAHPMLLPQDHLPARPITGDGKDAVAVVAEARRPLVHPVVNIADPYGRWLPAMPSHAKR